jgi:hypothetical protein
MMIEANTRKRRRLTAAAAEKLRHFSDDDGYVGLSAVVDHASANS